MIKFAVVSYDIKQWLITFLMILPGRAGSSLRNTLIPFKTIGEGAKLQPSIIIKSPNRLAIGDNFFIDSQSIINANGDVEIGNDVLIGPGVIIYSENHNYKDKTICIANQGYTRAKIVIEDDVWLGARSTILAGVSVRKGTVVAAGAVVTKDTELYSVVAGIPAVKIGQRF